MKDLKMTTIRIEKKLFNDIKKYCIEREIKFNNLIIDLLTKERKKANQLKNEF